MGGGEGWQGVAGGADVLKAWEGGYLHPEAVGGEKLRDEADIREAGACAEGEIAGMGLRGGEGFAGGKALGNPMSAPVERAGLVQPKSRFDVIEHPQVLQRMNIAGDDLCEGADMGAGDRVGGEQGGLRMDLLQPLDDCEGLGQNLRASFQCRNQTLRVYRGKGVGPLLTRAEVDRQGFGLHGFQVERDPAAIGGRGTEIAIEFQRHILPPDGFLNRSITYLPHIVAFSTICGTAGVRNNAAPMTPIIRGQHRADGFTAKVVLTASGVTARDRS